MWGTPVLLTFGKKKKRKIKGKTHRGVLHQCKGGKKKLSRDNVGGTREGKGHIGRMGGGGTATWGRKKHGGETSGKRKRGKVRI